MNANNFRIGNLVNTDFSESNIKTIVELKHKAASVKYIRTDTNEPHQSMVDYDRLIPIPLTEEILLKIKGIEYSNGEYNLSIEDASMKIFFYDCWRINITSEDFDITYEGLPKVHELQNMFALTGKELTITL
jgi:hypothetical protein